MLSGLLETCGFTCQLSLFTAICLTVGIVAVLFLVFSGGGGGTGFDRLVKNLREQSGIIGKQGKEVKSSIDQYNDLQDDASTSVEGRTASYKKLVDTYYDLATLFYEWGWATSFHFANRRQGEGFQESLIRHEHDLAKLLEVKPGQKVIDCGCGIGGPLRNIVRYTGADITGLTINEYQVKRGNELCHEAGLQDKARLVQGDFMHLPFPDNSFDGAYAIEACCHAPDPVGVYREVMRVLKPGAKFVTYEWCLTDKFDKTNPAHLKLKKEIEEGDGLPDTRTTAEVDAALQTAGFNVMSTKDCALEPNEGGKTWYVELTESYNIFSQRFQFTPIGKLVMGNVLTLLEAVHIAPKGTCKTQRMLQNAAVGLAAGGINLSFTPMYLTEAQKPK